jgi:hypothetical protein
MGDAIPTNDSQTRTAIALCDLASAIKDLVGMRSPPVVCFRPLFCNGPDEVKSPNDRHAAELSLLSVVSAEAATPMLSEGAVSLSRYAWFVA